jgi:hypothetical protein
VTENQKTIKVETERKVVGGWKKGIFVVPLRDRWVGSCSHIGLQKIIQVRRNVGAIVRLNRTETKGCQFLQTKEK